MLVIKFAIRGSKITWLINDNWVMLLSFLLTMTAGICFRRIKTSNKNIKMPNPKGGNFIHDCIETDSVYEVLDPTLEIVIKQILNLPPDSGPVIISVPVLIIAYIISRQPVKQLTFLGVSLFIEKFKPLAIKTAVGVASGSMFFFMPLGVVSLTSAILAGAIFFNVGQEYLRFECKNLISKVPMERVSKGKIVGFLDRPLENNPKVYIQDNKDTEIYFSSLDGSCHSEYKEVEVVESNGRKAKTESQIRIHRKCEKEYVPLRERTKTLSDLKKHDSTENREKAQPYIKRYQDRRKRIMNEREEL